MKTVYVNPIKFEYLKRYVWRNCLSDMPTLVQIGQAHVGVHMSNVVFAKDNTEVTATINFNTYSFAELERVTQEPFKVVMEFGDFPFEIVDVVTLPHVERFKEGTSVTVRIRVKNRAGRLSNMWHKFLKVFMG